MSRKHKFHNPEGVYFVSFAVINWIDLFVRRPYKDILVESLKYCQQNKGLIIYVWCIMTSHVHLIISSEINDLPGTMRDFKSYTSRNLQEAIKDNPQESRREWILWMMERAGRKNSNNSGLQLWQQHNKPIEIYSNDAIKQKLEYLHNNPVEEGFVNNAEDYAYCSAIDYGGGKGLLDVILIG